MKVTGSSSPEKIKEKWGKLTDDDLAQINGKREKLEGKLQQLYAHGNEQAKKEIDDFLELAFGERVWPGVTLTLPPIGAGLRWIMDPIIWQVMVGFVDETKWPTRTVRPAMECTNETTEFMASRPGPNIRPLQITPAHDGTSQGQKRH